VTEHGERMVIVYDGDCPFCRNYVRLMALREAVGRVRLVDARSGDPVVAELQHAGYDLNEGMVVRHGSKVYHGSDAVVLLSALAGDANPLSRLLSAVLRDPTRARALYPAMKLGRRLVLRALGRPDIKPDFA
jgi:predicted DCC family thiol-disulfide oxidoreductase YuxK